MSLSPWAGCSLPGANDFIELGAVDLDVLDAHGLHTLARHIGVVPISVAGKPLSVEVLKKELAEHASSA